VVAYKKGEIYEYGGEWDTDEVNLIDLNKLIREIGVVGEYKLWYICPGFDIVDGLRLLKTNRDVIRFINEHKNAVGVEFYVEAKDVEVEDCKCNNPIFRYFILYCFYVYLYMLVCDYLSLGVFSWVFMLEEYFSNLMSNGDLVIS